MSLFLRKRRRGGRAHQRNKCKHLQCFHRDYLIFPARGERIERKALPKIHYSHNRPSIGLNTPPRLTRRKRNNCYTARSLRTSRGNINPPD
jgi:hypothetical protein